MEGAASIKAFDLGYDDGAMMNLDRGRGLPSGVPNWTLPFASAMFVGLSSAMRARTEPTMEEMEVQISPPQTVTWEEDGTDTAFSGPY